MGRKWGEVGGGGVVRLVGSGWCGWWVVCGGVCGGSAGGGAGGYVGGGVGGYVGGGVGGGAGGRVYVVVQVVPVWVVRVV